MDYKEKYEQALDNIKRIKAANKDNKELVDFIEYQYPELKESEDERIKKNLITFFKNEYGTNSNAHFAGIKVKDIIAWLEKQGTKESKKTSIWKHWKDGIAGNGEGKLIYLIKDGNDYRLSSVLGHECDYVLLSDLDKLMLQEKQGHTDNIVEKAKTEKQRVIITETDGNANIDWDTRSLEDARRLLECGLQYVNTELEKQGEQKHIELKAGHWYFCHQAYFERADVLTVKKGEVFKCEKDGVVKGLIIKEPEKYFREISAPSDKLQRRI